MKILTKYSMLPVMLALTGALSGCSTDENPITPDKMQEIRKKQESERAGFHPDMGAPPRKTGD